MSASSPTLRPLVPVVAAALLGTVLLAAWIRLRPLPMPPALQVLLSVGVVVAVAAGLAVVRHGGGRRFHRRRALSGRREQGAAAPPGAAGAAMGCLTNARAGGEA
jgi:hypothetical protein